MLPNEMAIIELIEFATTKVNRDWWQVRGYELENLYEVFDKTEDYVKTKCVFLKEVHDKKLLNTDSLYKVSVQLKRMENEYRILLRNQKKDFDHFIEVSTWHSTNIDFIIETVETLIKNQFHSENTLVSPTNRRRKRPLLWQEGFDE